MNRTNVASELSVMNGLNLGDIAEFSGFDGEYSKKNDSFEERFQSDFAD